MKDYTNFYHSYKLLDWIDINKIDWAYISENHRAAYLIETNMRKITWRFLSLNESMYYMFIHKFYKK